MGVRAVVVELEVAGGLAMLVGMCNVHVVMCLQYLARFAQ